MTAWGQHETHSTRSPLDTENYVAKSTPRNQKGQEIGHDSESTNRVVTSGRSGREPDAARAICPSGGGLRKGTPLVMDEQASARAVDAVEEVHSKVAPISVGMLNSSRAGMPLGDHPKAWLQFVKDHWKRARAFARHTIKCHRMLEKIVEGRMSQVDPKIVGDDGIKEHILHTQDGESAASVKRTKPLLGLCQPRALLTAFVETGGEFGNDFEVDDTLRWLSHESGEARSWRRTLPRKMRYRGCWALKMVVLLDGIDGYWKVAVNDLVLLSAQLTIVGKLAREFVRAKIGTAYATVKLFHAKIYSK